MSDFLSPHGLYLARLLCPWNSPGKITGVGSHSLLQGIEPGLQSPALQEDFLLSELLWKPFHCVFIYYSVAQSCLTLCVCSTPGFPVLHYLLKFAHTYVHWVGDAIQPFHPLSPPLSPLCLVLPLIFPSIRVFSSESAVRIRWPKYWSIRFCIRFLANKSLSFLQKR